MQTETRTIYYIGTKHGTVYISYDSEVRTAHGMDGSSTIISIEKLTDFLHTAELLGFKTGKI